MFKTNYIMLFVLGYSIAIHSQHTPQKYYPETNPIVLEKLERWQDLKFGLLMHWGPYSQWGIVESWSLCSEDEDWTQRTKGRYQNYDQYKIDYENLKTTFNPVKFDPVRWAKAAKDGGMKYVVFTTKHHDGFCMFDSKFTDYKITDKDCPFHTHPKSNVAKEIFTAFRDEGLWTGSYFSKPDWHSEYYWWPYFATPDRNVNYDIDRYPERWNKFEEFTHNQILELMTDYGKMDILWLDGGWVDGKHMKQNIHMADLVKKVREKQPGLIVVDRAVEGPHQNYLTPENRVPEKMLPYPWESCIIMGGGWSYSFDPKFESTRELIHMLVDIVAKGGNLLLNIGPSPEGTWYDEAYIRLRDMGEWLEVNGEAIYNSRAYAPYQDGLVRFTRQKEDAVYAIFLGDLGESRPPSKIELNTIFPADDPKVTMLGVKDPLNWERVGEGICVFIPNTVQENPPCQHAWTLKISGFSK